MREQKSNVPGKSVRTVAEELEITRQTSGQHICTPSLFTLFACAFQHFNSMATILIFFLICWLLLITKSPVIAEPCGIYYCVHGQIEF